MMMSQVRSHLHKELLKTRNMDGHLQLVGLFPLTNNGNEVDIKAIAWAEAMKYEMNKRNKARQLKGEATFGYTIYNTCGSNLDVVTEIMLQVLVDTDDEICRCRHHTATSSSIIGIIGPSTSSATKYVTQMMALENMAVVSYGSTSAELSNTTQYPNLFRTSPPDTFQGKFITDVLLHFDMTYVSIVASDDSYGRYGIQVLKRQFINTNICTSLLETFDVPLIQQQLDQIVVALKKDTTNKVIVAWGTFYSIKAILETAYKHGLHNKTWIITEASGTNEWLASNENRLVGNYLIVTANGGYDSRFENHLLGLTFNSSEDNPWLQLYFRRRGHNESHGSDVPLHKLIHKYELGGGYGFVQNAVQIYYNAMAARCKANKSLCNSTSIHHHGTFNQQYLKQREFEADNYIGNGAVIASYDLWTTTNKMFRRILHWETIREAGKKGITSSTIDTFNETFDKQVRRLVEAHCSPPCQAGSHRVLDSQKTCCWKCLTCLHNEIFDGSECILCPELYISTRNQSYCSKITTYHYIHPLSHRSYAIYTVTLVGVIMTLATMVTFLISKHTPVVRASNVRTSLMQLTVHLVLFLLPLLFIGRTDKVKCVCRVYGITTSFVVIIALSIAKINHIVTVFKLKYRVDKSKIRKMKTTEISIVIAILIIEVGLGTILFTTFPFRLDYHLDRADNIEVSVRCNTSVHYPYLVCYIILLEIICGIQAFRGRKLPANYKETKYIAFTMFTLTLITGTRYYTML